ncbi:MAG: DNA polymerase IV [Arenimonas sp.]|nr:DNA polymerase IV [Arenimonas sp.]
MTGPRKIVHVDMDAFYASVEQRDDPALRGRPVVVAWRGARSVVCAASYEARVFGVRSAMPALRAEKLCPQAVFVPPDFARYKAVSRQVREIFARYTDLIEPLSLDEAYLDVTCDKGGLDSATAVAEAIRSAIRLETRLTASAGIAPNKFLAKIASDWRKPDGQFVVKPAQVLDFLAPLPVAKLPGVGKVMESRLAARGIANVGQLRAHGRLELERQFGRWGRRLHELSLGIDEHPVQSERPTTQVSAEDTYAVDVPLEATTEAITRLAEKAWAAAQRETGRSGRTVVLKLKTADFHSLTRSHTPAMPPSSLAEVLAIALGLRERVDLPARVRYRLVGVGLANFRRQDELPPQAALFGPQ